MSYKKEKNPNPILIYENIATVRNLRFRHFIGVIQALDNLILNVNNNNVLEKLGNIHKKVKLGSDLNINILMNVKNILK